MKYCIDCGKQLKEDAKFCTGCGTTQPDLQEKINSEYVEKTTVNEELPKKIVHNSLIEEKEVILEKNIQGIEEQADEDASTHSQYEEKRIESTDSNSGKLDSVLVETPEMVESTKESNKANQQENLILEKITHHSKNYFTYLNVNTISPIAVDPTDTGFFGLVNYGLIALFSALSFSRIVSAAANSPVGSILFGILGLGKNRNSSAESFIENIFSYLDDGYTGSSNNGNFEFFFPILFFTVILYGSFIIVPYLYQLLFSPYKPNFFKTANMICNPVSVGVYISLVIFILTFIIAPGSPIIFLGAFLPIFLFCLSSLVSLWSFDSKIKNRFYSFVGTILVGMILTIIILSVVMKLIV